MLPRLVGGLAFTVGAMAAVSQLSPASATDVRSMPMQFEWHREGPAGACRNNCRTWISAIGAITRDTPSDFDTFARNNDVHGATLVLDSSGGSVLGTLSLGRAIRRLGMTTTVGRTRKLAGPENEGRSALLPKADCESMCAFLLLAGKQRFVPAEAQVFVHEIWLGDRREDAAAATYSAEDLVIVQRDIGRLAQYTVEMGGSIDLLETALRIPPWEPMRKLSPTELRRMGLDTVATLPDAGSQAVAVSITAPRFSRAPATERGWAVNEAASQTTLSRQHPLTVEGDELGKFEVVFSCGPSRDVYDVTYIEKRRSADARPVAETLKQVTIAVGRRSVPLKIASSEVRPKQLDLESTARGTVPASFLDLLARDGNRSLTVTASTSNEIETVIRVGNTGMARNLSRLAVSCGEPGARVEVQTELPPGRTADAASVGRPK